MRVSESQRLFVLMVCLLLVLGLVGPSPSAQEKTKIAGKITATFTDQKSFDIGDAAGHTLALNLSEGTNVSTGPAKFMDSATVVNYSYGDLIKGNGPQNGYLRMALGADTVFVRWEHQTKTVVSAENVPVTTFEGTSHFIKGTGRFVNIQGDGTFKGSFLGPKTYAVDWQGEYTTSK